MVDVCYLFQVLICFYLVDFIQISFFIIIKPSMTSISRKKLFFLLTDKDEILQKSKV